jgi:hypothetical protein
VFTTTRHPRSVDDAGGNGPVGRVAADWFHDRVLEFHLPTNAAAATRAGAAAGTSGGKVAGSKWPGAGNWRYLADYAISATLANPENVTYDQNRNTFAVYRSDSCWSVL